MTLRDLLMLFVGMWVGKIATVFFAWWRTRGLHRALDNFPINVYGEIVLPMPDDLRWTGPVAKRQLGVVTVYDGSRLYLEGKQAPHNAITDRYCAAVAEEAKRRELDRLIAKVDLSVMEDTGIERRFSGKKR